MNYKTLLVAPKTDLLLVDDEVMQVNNLLGAKLLQGSQANIHGLLSILQNDFDIIWFSTHGDEQGVYLSDGILSTSEITALVRSTGASLVVFNTCSSRSVALSIYDELHIPFVCTIKAVPDRTAFIFGTLFARKISLGLSFSQAFVASRPGQDRIYTYLPEEELVLTMPPLDKDRPDNSSDLIRLTNSVHRLEILVSGNQDYGVEGLVPTVKKLETKIDTMSDQMRTITSTQNVITSNQEFNRRMMISVLVIMGIIILILGIWFLGRGGV